MKSVIAVERQFQITRAIPTASCPNLLLAGGGPPIKGGGEYRSTCDEGWPNEDGLAMAEEVGCLAMAEKHRNKKRGSRKHGGGGGAGKGGGASSFDFDLMWNII